MNVVASMLSYDIAQPDIAAVFRQHAVAYFMIRACLRLRDAKVDDGFAVIRMHARGPVLHRLPR